MLSYARFALPAAMAAMPWLAQTFVQGWFVEPAFAQRGGASLPGVPPASQPGNGAPSGRTGQTPAETNQGAQPGPLTPVFLTGQVALEDGSVPQGQVEIVLTCNGRRRVLGYADPKGYFNVQLGSPSPDVLDDASLPGRGIGDLPPTAGGSLPGRNPADSELVGCELRGQLPGYDSQDLELGVRQRMDNPNVGTILMRRLGPDQGTLVSSTTLSAPKEARKAYEKGLEAEKKKKLPEAEAQLQKAVTADPKYAIAWAELGKVQAAEGQADTARDSLKQSIAADPKFVPPYVEMSQLEFRAQHWQQVAEATDKAVALDPFHYPMMFFLNGAANYNLHNLDRAEQSVRRAQKLDPNHQIPQTSYLLGLILADRKNYAAAAEQMTEYLRLAPKASNAAEAREQLAHFEEQAKAAPEAQRQ
ncbi:MAG TPA: tetratricopeptide repeat protein [Bryobacteraceae bacterium]|nr:tetratricopeptide repeat protein [Bryobacteraceae bacterium]